MTRLLRTAVSQGSGVPSTALCVWHPAVNTQPTMALRRSKLKLLFGQEKDSSAHGMASTRGVSSSLAGDNLGHMLSFTQRTPCSREGARSTPGEAVLWEHSRSSETSYQGELHRIIELFSSKKNSEMTQL